MYLEYFLILFTEEKIAYFEECLEYSLGNQNSLCLNKQTPS